MRKPMRTFDYFQISLALFGLTIFLFLMIGVLYDLPYLHWIDQLGFHQIREPLTDERSWFFRNVTRAGNTRWTAVVMAATIAVSLIVKKYDIAVFMFVNVAVFALGGMVVLKHTFNRPRPDLLHLVSASGTSFPSGHALNSILLYGSLIVLTHYYVRNIYLRYAFTTLLATLIIAIPMSRVYLGVHYLSDVLAGMSLGTFFLIMSKEFIFKYRTREFFENEENT